MDRIKAMHAFVRAIELGSLSAAARELATTQPTVSKLVASLEASIGVRLLERTTTRVLPTAEGERFLASARQLVEQYEEAVADLHERIRQPKGLVRVSAPVALGELRVSRLMLQALEAFPLLQVELLLEDRFIDPVEERVDLALRIGGALPPDLVARPLATWPRYLVAAPDYVRLHGQPRRPEELHTHRYLRYAGADDTVVLTSQARSIRVDVPTRYRVNSAVALLEAVQGGAGLALQPSWMVDALLARGSLVRVLPKWTGPEQKAHLLHAPRRKQSMRVQAVMDYLLENVPRW